MADYWRFLTDFEGINTLHEGTKKMAKSQTARSKNKPVASMSSLIKYFAAIEGSIMEKQKWILQGPP